jgi:hypothetical protein
MLEIPGAMMKGRNRSILYPTQPSAQKFDGLDTNQQFQTQILTEGTSE